ncbi:MAG: hypothetical protein K0R83_717 [Caulobacter sp.]|jgi:hypothetical protein|nr:hypothetical protein [Caulobacter sp.]
MATRTVERTDGVTTERETTRDGGSPVYVERSGGGGMGAVLIGIGVLALIAIVAFFLVNQQNSDALRTQAVTDAAANVSQSAADAASNVSGAANRAADAVTPPPVAPAPAPEPAPPPSN